jgi:hypothetical protein
LKPKLRLPLPFEQILRYLLRDRDGIFGSEFRKDVAALGIQVQMLTDVSTRESKFNSSRDANQLTI